MTVSDVRPDTQLASAHPPPARSTASSRQAGHRRPLHDGCSHQSLDHGDEPRAARLVRPRAVPPEPVLPDRPVRRRLEHARAPSVDRRRAVLQLSAVCSCASGRPTCGSARTASGWRASATCSPGTTTNLPEVGKYNAGQKMVFWSMSVLIVVLITSGFVIWDQYFYEYTTIEQKRHRRAGPFDRGDGRDLRVDRPRLRRDLGARHDPRHDARAGDRRLGLAASPQVAARARRREEGRSSSPGSGARRSSRPLHLEVPRGPCGS